MWQCVEMLNLCQVAKIKDQNHEKSPNFIRTKDGYRITYVLVS